jgi:SAM-dependent methyltransferase
MMEADTMNCTVCGEMLKKGLQDWHFVCSSCGYEKSVLEPTINEEKSHEHIDESARRSGLATLRKANFKRLVHILKNLRPEPGGHLLDVGSAHGWFLEEAAAHFKVLGIEPDQGVYEKSKANGHPQRVGYFPEALKEGEVFDVIVFNDVIEHIPPISKILEACHKNLKEGGLLLLNIPSSKGIFYRLSRIFIRLGIKSPFDRMWQKGLPSPHVHYFNEDNLRVLVEHMGFRERLRGALPSLSTQGLLTRISYASTWPEALNYALWVVLLILTPIINVLPKDTIFIIFERKDIEP